MYYTFQTNDDPEHSSQSKQITANRLKTFHCGEQSECNCKEKRSAIKQKFFHSSFDCKSVTTFPIRKIPFTKRNFYCFSINFFFWFGCRNEVKIDVLNFVSKVCNNLMGLLANFVENAKCFKTGYLFIWISLKLCCVFIKERNISLILSIIGYWHSENDLKPI